MLDSNDEHPEMPEGALPETLENNEDPVYPGAWRDANYLLGTQVRQISFDTYQLRSASHQITINHEGFDLYRDGSPAGQTIFEDWCSRNNIVAVPLDPHTGEAING
jgi:hypothetical protein